MITFSIIPLEKSNMNFYVDYNMKEIYFIKDILNKSIYEINYVYRITICKSYNNNGSLLVALNKYTYKPSCNNHIRIEEFKSIFTNIIMEYKKLLLY